MDPNPARTHVTSYKANIDQGPIHHTAPDLSLRPKLTQLDKLDIYLLYCP